MLHNGDEKFSKAFLHAPVLMTISAIEDGRYLDVNDRYCEVSGFSREEALGKTSIELGWISPRERERIVAALKRDGHVSNMVLTLSAKSGKPVCCLYSAETIMVGGLSRLLSIAVDISEQKKYLEELDSARECFAQAISGSQHILYRLNVKKGGYDYISPLFEQVTGYLVNEFAHTKLEDLLTYFHPDDRARVHGLIEHAVRTRTSPTVNFDLEYRFRKADGSYCWLHDVSTACFDDEGSLEYFFGSARDITDRKIHEREMERLNRLYAVLCNVNEAIVRIRSREELFAEVNHALVEIGKFKMVWIGLTNPETREVEMVAHRGDDSGYLDRLHVYADDRPEGRGPTGTAIREGRTYICNDFFDDPRTIPWRDAAARAGWHSSAAFPIRQGGKCSGALTIYALEANFFGEREVQLLEEVVVDVSFGLENLEHEALREQAEMALRASEEKYRNIFENAPVGIFQSTVTGRFLSVNRTLARQFAFESCAEIIAAVTDIPRQIFVKPGQRTEIIGAALATKEYAVREVDYRRKDGSIFLANLYMRAVRAENGEILYLEGFVEDITDRKRAEEQLRELNAELEQRVRERTAELESVNAMLIREIEVRKEAQDEVICLNEDLQEQKTALETANGELESFSYTVSHDLRAPLRRVGEFSRILEESCARKLDETERGYLRRIIRSTVAMDNLVGALLNLSRVNRTEMKRSAIDLSGIARKILADLAASEPGRCVRFDVEEGVVVEADPGLIRGVLENLLGNAWKYSARKDDAAIYFGTVALDGRRACFVRDNGAGFDMAYADRLFIPFQRLHHQEFEGIGIGLATVQRIIHRHGGRIWAEGVPGQGATFYFTLG